MFTVKLFRGNSDDKLDPRVPHTSRFLHAHTVEVSRSDHGKQIVLDPGQQTEHYEYVSNLEAAGDPISWDWAVIENAAGKTTEVVRP